jgi:prepilin-type processing-associated H-X9-DG protein
VWGGWAGSRLRHARTMNILFADGHVETSDGQAINPKVASIETEMWKPNSDQK